MPRLCNNKQSDNLQELITGVGVVVWLGDGPGNLSVDTAAIAGRFALGQEDLAFVGVPQESQGRKESAHTQAGGHAGVTADFGAVDAGSNLTRHGCSVNSENGSVETGEVGTHF